MNKFYNKEVENMTVMIKLVMLMPLQRDIFSHKNMGYLDGLNGLVEKKKHGTYNLE